MWPGKLIFFFAALAAIAVLAGTVALYSHPTVLVMLTDLMWACFN